MTTGQGRTALGALLVSLVSFSVFALIAWNVQTPSGLTDLDERIALDFADLKSAMPTLTAFISRATDLGSWNVLVGVVALSGLVVLWRWPRRWLLPLLWLVILIGGNRLMHGLKEVFHRPRPLEAATWPSWSFPSGHSSDALVNYGMLAYLLVLALPHRAARVTAIVFLTGVVLLVGFSRMYLTVHYFSDVLGGFALGAGWLAVWIAALETIRLRSEGTAAPGETGAPF